MASPRNFLVPAALLLCAGSPCLAQPIRVNAEAAPHNLYAEWGQAYESHSKTKVAAGRAQYQDILRLDSSDADFGAVDLPLSVPQLRAKGLVQFPTAIGGVVPVVNLPGVVPGALHLTGPVLARIFLGEVTRWNDPTLVALNPTLPSLDGPIRVVHLTDPSGTTYVFTSYLSAQSSTFQSRVRTGLAVAWPVGEARPDGPALASYVQRTPGSIGYTDYASAAEVGAGKPSLQNKAGQFVAPTTMSFQAAAANAPWDQAPAFGLSLVDQGGAGSWPLTAPTYAILPLRVRSPARTLEVLRFLDWNLKNSAAATADAGFVPLPRPIVALVEAAWKRLLKGADGVPVWAE